MDMRVKAQFWFQVWRTLKKPISAPRCRGSGRLPEGFPHWREQEIVDDLLVLQGQWGERTRQREDHMHVAGWQKLLSTGGDPPFRAAV